MKIMFELSEENKQHKYNRGEYIERAFEIVDRNLDEAVVDAVFYQDYYSLKSDVDRYNNYFTPTILSVATSITVSLALGLADGFPASYIDYIVGALIVALVMVSIFGVHRMLYLPSYNVIYPYILKGMEKN